MIEGTGRLQSYRRAFGFHRRVGLYRVEFSNRLTSNSGRCHFRDRRIVLSGLFFKRYGWAEMDQTLRHETVHATLYEEGLPLHHGSRYFREYADRAGAQLWHNMSLEPNYIYECPSCSRIVKRVRPLRPETACGAHGCWGPEYVLILRHRRSSWEMTTVQVGGGAGGWASR